jgi:hypothetical protein
MWKCPNKKLKDLYLADKETLDKDKYRDLLQRFVVDTESINLKVDRDFLRDLNQLPEIGILRSRKIKNSDRYSRKGYFTLYRWCATEHNAAKKVSGSANKLWNFLFRYLPPKLAESENSYLTVDNELWEYWFNNICKPLPSDEIPLSDKTIEISEGQTGVSYEKLFRPYLIGSSSIVLVDPYIRYKHQLKNLISFCEVLFTLDGEIELKLITAADSKSQIQYLSETFDNIKEPLKKEKLIFSYKFEEKIHDRWIESDNGWKILLSRGLDIFKKSNIELSKQEYFTCKATTITYTKPPGSKNLQ